MNSNLEMLAQHLSGAEFACVEGGGYEAATQVRNDVRFLGENQAPHKSYLCNSFSLQMIGDFALMSKMPADISEVPADALNCIGHEDTAAIIGGMLKRELHANRVPVSLEPGDVAFVFQVTGGRLPEGATTIPEGMSIKLFKVLVR